MKTKLFALAIVIVLLLSACGTATPKVGSIQINNPWVKVADSGANTAAFMVIKNSGSQADRLVKAEFSSAKMVKLMDVAEKDGKMQMVDVDAIEVPAAGQVELKSGSFHVMLMGLSQELKAGGKITLKLTFEKSGTLTFDLPVKSE